MAKKKWLTRAHFDLMGRVHYGFPRDAERFVRKMPGMNARSVTLLCKLGLLEFKVTQGPRGGRIVWYRLTAAGKELMERVSAHIEGTHDPRHVDGQGNYIRELRTDKFTFAWGNV